MSLNYIPKRYFSCSQPTSNLYNRNAYDINVHRDMPIRNLLVNSQNTEPHSVGILTRNSRLNTIHLVTLNRMDTIYIPHNEWVV